VVSGDGQETTCEALAVDQHCGGWHDLSATPRLGTVLVPVHPRTGETAVISVHVENEGQGSVVIAVFRDGMIVQSADNLRGGAPFKACRVDPSEVKKVAKECTTLRGFAQSPLQSWTGPDAADTVIGLSADDGTRCQLCSWHELAEATGSVQATDKGLLPIQEGSPTPASTPEYARFRQRWAKMRQRLDELAASGQPLPGPANMACKSMPTYSR